MTYVCPSCWRKRYRMANVLALTQFSTAYSALTLHTRRRIEKKVSYILSCKYSDVLERVKIWVVNLGLL